MSKLFEDSGKRLSKVIDYEDIKFDFIDQIGSGGFGKVYAGFLNGRKIGIKKITIYDNDPNKNILLKFLEREIYTLKMLSHPNVIQFYGIAEKERSLFLLTELVSGGDLHWYIKNKDIKMPWKLKFKIARDIAASMDYLHSNGVIHRDLKSTNLLVAENWVIKVCDMGLARKMDKSEKSKMTICGTDDWMAPEVLIGEEYDSACDVFSFGMVLIELITRENLSPRIRNEELGVDNVYFYSRIPDGCPKELVRLVNECCKVVPGERPNFYNIYGLLNYLLNNYDLGDDYEPPLRTFKPPELHIPIVNNQNDDSGFSFPRPFQESNINNNNNNNQQQQQQLESDFSFPRPYQPSNINSNNNNNNNQSLESSFSFPRPYQPSNINNSNNNNQNQDFSFSRPFQPDDAQQQEDEEVFVEEEEEMKQLKRQLFSRFNSQDSFPRPFQQSKIVTFEESELLSFPRPYQPDNDSNSTNKPLLENPNFSFPRPYNPDTDSTFRNSPTDQLKSKIIFPSSDNAINTTASTEVTNNELPSSQPTSRISISTATVNKPSNSSIFRSTATVQNKSRSMSTPVKPSNSLVNNSASTSTSTATLNSNNASFPKSKTPTSTPTNKVVIGNGRENSSKNLLLNQSSQNNYSNRVITINKSNNNLANTLNNTSTGSLNNSINNSNNNNNKKPINNNYTSNNIPKNFNNITTTATNNNNKNQVSNSVKVVVTNTSNNNNKKDDTKLNTVVTNSNNSNKQEDKIISNSGEENNQEELESGDKVIHRRSRSLDIKSSTKGLIKKFEELTRFNSQQSNINGISKIEGKLHFGSETLTYEKVSPRNNVNNNNINNNLNNINKTNNVTNNNNNNNNNNITNNNNNSIQAPLSPKKGFWLPKK